MAYLKPFVIFTGRHMDPGELAGHAENYRDVLVDLRDGRLDPFSQLASNFELPKAFGSRVKRIENALG